VDDAFNEDHSVEGVKRCKEGIEGCVTAPTSLKPLDELHREDGAPAELRDVLRDHNFWLPLERLSQAVARGRLSLEVDLAQDALTQFGDRFRNRH
jgi:hypothetical protein